MLVSLLPAGKVADSWKDSSSPDAAPRIVPWMKEAGLRHTGHQSPLKGPDSTPADVGLSPAAGNVTQDCDSVKKSNRSNDMLIDLEPSGSTSGCELSSPVSRTAVPPMEEEQDENTPPAGQDRNENILLAVEEVPQKTTLSPLK